MKLSRFAVLAVTACAAFPTAALADPIYLSCDYADGQYTEHLDFTLDEKAGTVTLTSSSVGYTPTFRAGFAPDRVTFRDNILNSYSISRTDLSLSISRAGEITNTGRCKLKTAPKRAF